MEILFSVTGHDVVKDEPVTLFSPKNPVPHETIFMSNIDQAVSFPVETLFFYKVEKDTISTCDISERIKKAVSEILVPYYFMAGRLNFNCKSSRLELFCNNAGVAFVGAKSRLLLSDLGDLSLPNPSFGHFLHRPRLYGSLAEKPLFTVQVTRFGCGGFSIGFITNHGILDGKSACDMFENLASICRGEGLKTSIIHNDRTCLRATDPPTIKHQHKEYIIMPKISSLSTAFTTAFEPTPSPLIFKKEYYHKLFSLSADFVQQLKNKAMTKCSSFEAVIAHIWKVRTKVIFKNPNDFSTVFFAVDIRKIVSPPLPNGFVGNAVVTAHATSRVVDLVENSISYGVGLIKEGKERITEEYVRSVIDWLEIYEGVPATINGNFYVSAWWKLPFGEIDFGFGRPVRGGPVVSGNDEFALLLSNRNGSQNGHAGVNVWMSLEHEKMNKFMSYVFEI